MSAAPPSTASRTLRFLATLAVFALVGPLVGGLITLAGLAGQISGWTSSDTPMTFMAMAIYGLWAAYPLGIVPALIAGAAIAAKRLNGGEAGFPVALATGAVTGLVWTYGFMDAGRLDPPWLSVVFVVAAIGATLACWAITGGAARAVALARGERRS
ncbi:MAG: hypothetical protein AB7L41_11785 [Flavobacteriaceae bacterium]